VVFLLFLQNILFFRILRQTFSRFSIQCPVIFIHNTFSRARLFGSWCCTYLLLNSQYTRSDVITLIKLHCSCRENLSVTAHCCTSSHKTHGNSTHCGFAQQSDLKPKSQNCAFALPLLPLKINKYFISWVRDTAQLSKTQSALCPHWIYISPQCHAKTQYFVINLLSVNRVSNFVIILNYKKYFIKNSTRGFRGVTLGRTDRLTDIKKLTVTFQKFCRSK
jgi:hypothetical protein